MIRSLFSGVSGMKNHQIRMDVIGNNISNVNTTGFKAGRTNFQDTLYQTIKSGGISTNPAQTGLGINVASISNYMEPGGLQSTGRTLDLGINGNGFFKVNKGADDNYYTRDGIFYLTQDGRMVNSDGYQLVGTTWEKAKSFATNLDPNNAIATPGTLEVRGVLADGTVGQTVQIDFNAGESINDVLTKINAEQSTSGVMAYKRPNATNPDQFDLYITTVYDGYDEIYTDVANPALTVTDGSSLDLDGGNLERNITNYTKNVPIQITNVPISSINIQNNGMITGQDNKGAPLLFEGDYDVANITLYMFPNQDGLERINQNLFRESVSSGTAEAGIPGETGYGTIESGFLEMSNVDLTDEFTNMIVTQRGYQANSRIITVSDTMLEELMNLKR
ncbi:flagellar hook protein FlgE [Desulfoscipio geothermicus]|jgi:flagellar hook protein FlgE|uniref:Flagellar hook protein FlgE n=1 Tax=Desulfoscipio geothermicus DSM 3669 TaxID=1121426 RepID=A0A1I6CV61_9FIRM|nr:flagellar hook-basal body complex protein [Desulfoscipio geothermicus]SFQ97066.1 flagellar hook protein FlgE [Desulfoscipio geothermicus DSM 3669]